MFSYGLLHCVCSDLIWRKNVIGISTTLFYSETIEHPFDTIDHLCYGCCAHRKYTKFIEHGFLRSA